jgi:antitoxin VapB
MFYPLARFLKLTRNGCIRPRFLQIKIRPDQHLVGRLVAAEDVTVDGDVRQSLSEREALRSCWMKVEHTFLGTKQPAMALSIKDPEIERLARSLAQLTGENITTATKRAIEERLRRFGGQSRKAALLEDMAEIRRRWSEMPVVDGRTPEEILGYDEHGLPR